MTFFCSKVMIQSVEELNKMAKALIAEHFPEVTTWNSHLHSDALGVSLCNKCGEIGNQGLDQKCTILLFVIMIVRTYIRSLDRHHWPCKHEKFSFDFGWICDDRYYKHFAFKKSRIVPATGTLFRWHPGRFFVKPRLQLLLNHVCNDKY